MAGGRVINLEVWLTDAQHAALSSEVERMNSHLRKSRRAPDWNEEKELVSIIALRLTEVAINERRNREIAAEVAPHDFMPSVPDVPAWLREINHEAAAELGLLCPSCARPHDVIGRVSGEMILCPCGALFPVRFKAKVVAE